jgi:hypothetical protein
MPYARVAKLVDALVLGTNAARRGGSSPLPGTNIGKIAILVSLCSNEKVWITRVRKGESIRQ